MAKKKCPRCGERLSGEEAECPFCRLEFEPFVPPIPAGMEPKDGSAEALEQSTKALAREDADLKRRRRERKRQRQVAYEAERLQADRKKLPKFLRETRALLVEAWSIFAVRVTIVLVSIFATIALVALLTLQATHSNVEALKAAADRIEEALRAIFE